MQDVVPNQRTYCTSEVASHYAGLNYLTPCERLLFQSYIKPGMAVLDLGVGGGRTTSYLSRIASRYLGVDYSDAMIRTCRRKFPDLDFLLADASDLSDLNRESFDAVIFSYNGLDCMVPDEKRLRCLRECWRVLRANGVLVFSSHNPRSILVRADWKRGRLRAFARKKIGRRRVIFSFAVAALSGVKGAQAGLRASFRSISRIIRRLPSAAFWRGEGELYDPVDGGLTLHHSTPVRTIVQLMKSDFQLVDFLGDDYPRASNLFVTDWYYYVFRKKDNQSTGRQVCA